MNKKAIYTLEFDKIREILSGCADSPLGKKLCDELLPSCDMEQINTRLYNTRDALSKIYAKGKVSFRGLKDVSSHVKRLELEGILNPSEFIDIRTLLCTAKQVQEYYEDTDDTLSEYISALFYPAVLVTEIDRCIISEDEINDNASPKLRSIRKSKAGFRERIQSTLNSLLASSMRTFLQEPIITMRGERYCVPVKAEHRMNVKGIVHDRSSTGATLFIEPASVVDLNNELRQLELSEREEIQKILRELSLLANEHSQEILSNQRLLTNLDFIFAKGELAKKLKCTFPLMNSERVIDLKSARHPLIDLSAVVPIDFKIGEDYRQLIITGPNTGGKTVTLKTAGLLTLMAQAGLFIPASEGSKTGLFKDVFADIGDEQSIEQSLSTFSSHMTNIARILKNADKDSLLLFDEIGAGTDPTEGAALATAILDDLRKKDITTLATTHYSELKLYALSSEGVENAGCEFDIKTLRPTYKLLIGVPGKSNAFAISKKLGLSQYLIDDALKRLSDSEIRFEDIISDLDRARRVALKDKDEISGHKKEIDKLRRETEELHKKAAVSRDKILKNANEEAARILAEAKKNADAAIKTLNKKEYSLSELEKTRNELRNKSEKRKDIASSYKTLDDKPVIKNRRKVNDVSELSSGTPVHIISMDIDGVIADEPDSKGNIYVSLGSFKTRVKMKDLEITNDDNSHSKSFEKSNVNISNSIASKIKVNKTANISPEINILGMTVDEARIVLDKYIDDAYLSGLSEVRIVHGKGTGALRKGVYNYLKNLPHVENHRLGDEGEGGDGVTIVRFK